MKKVPGSLLALPLCLVALACDPPILQDAGPLPGKDGGAEPGETDAGDGGDVVVPDAGMDAGPDGGFDAGNGPSGDEDGGIEPSDGGADGDAGTDGGPPVNPDDEAGGLENPAPASLPFSTTVNLQPAGDTDCFVVDVETGGVLTIETSNVTTSTCSGQDTEVFLYAAGTTDIGAYIANNDDRMVGQRCSFLEETVGPGSYVVCVEHYSRDSPDPITGAILNIEFDGFVCGDDVLDPGEECDGVPNCTASCLLDDGVTREDEMGGNNVPQGGGLQEMFLDEPVRGTIMPGSDVDWWLLQLPGGLNPGAVVLKMGGIDLASNSCGAADDIRADIYSGGGLDTPAATSTTGSPCRVTTLTQVNGDAVFGDETLLVRVNATQDGGHYSLVATYIEGECGNGAIEPSEECDPEVEPLGADCHPVTCRLVVPTNDTCEAAIDITDMLPEVGQHLVLSGQTITASDSTAYTGSDSCHGTSTSIVRRDVHYTFTAPSDGIIVADLQTSWDAVLYLTEGVCQTGIDCSDPGDIEEFVTAGQTYTLVVDGYGDGNGRFDLEVQFLPAPENNTCEAATLIDIPTDGTKLTIAGDTRPASDSTEWTGTGSCQSSSSTAVGRDVHYRFTAPISGILIAELDASWDEALYLTEGECGSPLRCSDPGTLQEPVVQGQTYTIVVDAYGSAAGAFDLNLEILPLADNDTCTTATDITTELPLDGSVLTIEGDTRAATDAQDWTGSGSCHTSTTSSRTAPEVFYTFTAQQTGRVFLDLDSPDWDAVIYTFEGRACDAASAGACNNTPEELMFDVVQGETYTVVVDGYSTQSGPFTLEVFYVFPPPNDVCGDVAAVDLPVDGTPLVFTGDTRFASNEASVDDCFQSGSSHQETFHVFTAPIDGTVDVRLDTPSWDAMLYAWDSCAGDTELECADAENFSVQVTAGQQLVIVVDAYGSGSGEYTLNISYDIPPPFLGGGDSCYDATPLPSLVGALQGTLDGASPDYDAEDHGDCADGWASLGPDVVYSIELQPGQTLYAFHDADESDNDEQILLLDACPPVANSCVAGADFTPVEVSYTHTGSTPKTYYIVIDEYGSSESDWSRGTFELEWSVTGP